MTARASLAVVRAKLLPKGARPPAPPSRDPWLLILRENVAFFVARVEGQPAACGGVLLVPGRYAEVKRMYVRPEFRRRGISRRILCELEAKARELGYSILKLETGARQPDALALYRSAGYAEIPAFGEYVGNPYSLCFEKRLS